MQQKSPKRLKHGGASTSYPSPPQQQPEPPRLTREQEASVMVAALKNVIAGGTAIDMTHEFRLFEFTTTTTANATTDQERPLFPVPDPDTCQFCKIKGCLGCNFFPPTQEDKKGTAPKKKKKNYRSQTAAVGEVGGGDPGPAAGSTGVAGDVRDGGGSGAGLREGRH
ncbi:Ethylene-responsive transcription factor ERF109 [Camellia lanceoleosa]|uniref:Ethylene-responsive transcription factor ERF109 n=1 Tax=Camellia lanceoleosa TaxID=1840588 RepID=A0ACC0HPI7_9ERIC|nr:Ethylene-responsive transcription factor ERF109 [Camellia lanceoleosa]